MSGWGSEAARAAMNDTTMRCQNASVTEPQREAVPKRLRQLLLRPHSKAANQVDFVLHEGFHQNAQHPRRKKIEIPSYEGAIKKVVKVFEGVWGNFFPKVPPQQFSPLKQLSHKKLT